jgi:hypothetical protein
VAPAIDFIVDDARRLIWCLVEERRLLPAASSVDGGVRASWSPGLSQPAFVEFVADLIRLTIRPPA